jgi:hypothetical protein
VRREVQTLLPSPFCISPFIPFGESFDSTKVVIELTTKEQMKAIRDKAARGEKLTSSEDYDLRRAENVAGSYGNDARAAREAYDKKRK